MLTITASNRDGLEILFCFDEDWAGIDALAWGNLPSRAVGEEPADVIKNLKNRFEGLDIQEPSELFLQAPNVTPTTSTEAKSEVNHEAERLQVFEEAYLGSNLLLQDFRNLLTVILRTWMGDKYGMFDMVAASLVTNTAIEICQANAGGSTEALRQLDKYGRSQ
ncbi:hypothetical protein EYZ11_004924 [Aspergillus tanneri]|uniref:DUF6604 domain-containing protein n=1 Tax=Aspergillus tanneri TaxID=1220188 RepID=A0A4S3JJ82_9EURO|nr:uncharacterized protein ATNIH1004_004671 [Aspergillus tanneri]KAA8648786.1 hypothetical protein ATNIH1004_004671 [Aspergillus tanneri]THC95609.1 hypothetical protein EYZ11_004924 [Aspergillus tanneri]